MKSNDPQPIVIPPDSGKVLQFLGVTHKLTPQQTNSAYYLFEFEFDPESGNRLHVHSYEDEVVYVLEAPSRSDLIIKNCKPSQAV